MTLTGTVRAYGLLPRMPNIVKFISKPYKKKPVSNLYYHNGFLFYTNISVFKLGQEEDDDGCSMITVDAMETVDDNPGAGRTVDKYFFQPVGRKIERFAMRVAIAYLPPWKISRYFGDCPYLDSDIPYRPRIGQALSFLGSLKGGTTIIAGLKSIVKQTQ